MKSILLSLNGLILALTLNAQGTKSLADSNNAFAFDLYSQIKTTDGSNLFFSPFSISSALAMTYAGARTETEKQMSKTLHFSLDQHTFNTDFKLY
jgi:serpin B